MIDGISIPSHWAWATFNDVARVASDLTDPALTPDAPHIAPNHIESKTGKLLPFTTVSSDKVTSPKHRFHAGQILYSKIRPYLAKVVQVSFDGLCSADMYPVDALIDSKYLYHWLLSPWFTAETSQNQGRTVLPKINQVALGRLPVPVAPWREQQRIASKIEELFSDLDAGVAALKRAKANLKRYRAAVLTAAVGGKLTEEWRAKHSNTEPASKLIDRMLTERRQKWEADQLAKFAAAKKEPSKNWREKYIEPSPSDTLGLPELPVSWCWASMQQIGSVQLGRQRAPQHHNGPNMRPYLRVANVFEDRIDSSDVMEMNFTPNEFETYRLSFGDILLNEGQSMELIGRPAMYRDEVPGACFTNTLVRFRPLDGVDAHFALKVFLAYLKNGRFQKIATITVNIAHLGAGRFSEIEFPLPPVDEQAAIIAEVDRHFSLIDVAERSVESGLLRAARLRQSILKQAFEGNLVDQDPTDEPASELIGRIRQQHSTSKTIRIRTGTQTGTSNDVFDRRTSVVCYIVRRLHRQTSFGQIQLMKAIHLTQYHVGVDLEFAFKRDQFGPFDKALYDLESAAVEADWFSTRERPKGGVTYHLGTKIDEMCDIATEQFASKRSEIDNLLDHISQMNTDEAELFATAYAAWNDLLIDGRPADDAEIIAEVHGWHKEKKRFKPPMIRARLDWMRTQGYVPTGQGQRIEVIEKKTKRRSLRIVKSKDVR